MPGGQPGLRRPCRQEKAGQGSGGLFPETAPGPGWGTEVTPATFCRLVGEAGPLWAEGPASRCKESLGREAAQPSLENAICHSPGFKPRTAWF